METRVAVVGLGTQGLLHARSLEAGEVPGASLSAVVSRRPDAGGPEIGNARRFGSLNGLLDAAVCDAVIVATPHPVHFEQIMAALSAGLHVLCEKPASLLTREARKMASASEQHGRVYALNLNRRTVPLYGRVRELVRNGDLGEIHRIQWTSTAWLRSQAYFDSSPWRGTWAGEGGGLLVNQWPHVLDLWQWIFGLPTRLQAHCGFGKRHAIEVEDEVSVFAEYAGGATAFLVGSTGEAPGSDRLEVVGSRGRLSAEGSELTITRLEQDVDEAIQKAESGFPHASSTTTVETHDPHGDYAAGVTRDFVTAVRAGGDHSLLAPGSEGVASVMLANAILLSGWDDGAWVNLPLAALDEERFERMLSARMGR